MAIVLLSLIASLVAPLLYPTMAVRQSSIDLRKICGHDRARDEKKYTTSFFNITKTMQEEMQKISFAMRKGGENPNSIYMLSQCTNDLSSNDCGACFSQISTILGDCLPFTSGHIFFDECFMRFDNYSFFHETTSKSIDEQLCSNETMGASKQYTEAAATLIDDLIERAPKNSGYAKGKMKSRDDDDFAVHGTVSCLRTLDSRRCSMCLANASAAAVRCLPAVEGIAFNAGCFVRYSNQPFSRKNAFLTYIKYAFGVAACFLVVFIGGVFLGKFVYKRRRNDCKFVYKRRRNDRPHKTNGLEIDSLVTISMRFKYSTLQKATEDFSDSKRIGQGGYGEVFKGALQDGREIAVKRLFISGGNQIQTVCTEMDIICLAQHKNLVRFLGSCFESDILLVYEFVANGSLDRTLFDPEKKKELDWRRRLDIIEGTAKGLEYLHKECQARIIHRDIKASNILLDWKYRPKISDFGLARFYSSDQIVSHIAIAGTLGYMAPEYLAQGRLTEKVDIYSYGVLVLEIISGVQNNKYHSEDVLSTLVTTTWKHFQLNTTRDIIDTSITIEGTNEVLRIVQIGLLCTQESPWLRPDMENVVQWLKNRDLELPTPSKPPFADEFLTMSDSSLDCCSLRPHEHSISVDSCKYYDVDSNDQR